MADYKRILVVVTPHREEQPALERAVFLANKYNAELILASSMYNRTIEKSSNVTNESCDDLKKALLDDQINVMESMASSLSVNEKVECKVTWNKKWYEGVIDLAIQFDCDLIIKETKNDQKAANILFTPDHWNLLRYSPINVLMVTNTSWKESGNIVTAISLDGGDIQHQRLAQEVAKESVALAKYYDSKLHFVNTVTKAPMHIQVDRSAFDPDKVNERVMAKHKGDIQELSDTLGLHDVNIIVKEGIPGKVVPQICKELDAKILVLGSVGRKGINAALLGNTAEHIIDKIDCDTLIIKG